MHQILKNKRLSDFCPTRRVEKVIGFDDFEKLFAPIVFCFEEMSLNMGRVYNQNTSAKATSFYKLMTLFDFLSSLAITRSILDLTLLVSSLAITRSILDLTLLVTQFLQGPETNTANATRLTKSLKSLICCKNNTVETFYKKCYSNILELAYNLDIKKIYVA